MLSRVDPVVVFSGLCDWSVGTEKGVSLEFLMVCFSVLNESVKLFLCTERNEVHVEGQADRSNVDPLGLDELWDEVKFGSAGGMR